MLLPQTVERLAEIGANIELTAETGYLPQAIETIIKIVVGKGGHVTVDANGFTPDSLERFAKIGHSNLTIRV